LINPGFDQTWSGSRYRPALYSQLNKHMSDFQVPKHLPEWVEDSLSKGKNILATSNQGTILMFREAGLEFVVKTAMGKGGLRRARQATLLREHQAYTRLGGVSGVPKCYGLVADRYLVLEFVHGVAYRDAIIEDREAWFGKLLGIIREIHDRGVSHGDLKSKSNLVMSSDGQPCVIDFGTTVIRKKGFHPFNSRMFEYARQLDINAWVKHKYHGRYEDASGPDRDLLNYSPFETFLRRYRKWKKSRR